jgi:hypothetical protein
MTVLALQPEPLHMMFVAERDWLRCALALASHPRGALQVIQHHARRDQNHSGKNKTETGQVIRAAIKNLRHFWITSLLDCAAQCRCGWSNSFGWQKCRDGSDEQKFSGKQNFLLKA